MEGRRKVRKDRKGQPELLINPLLTFALVNTDVGVIREVGKRKN